MTNITPSFSEGLSRFQELSITSMNSKHEESATKTIGHCPYCKDKVDKRPVATILHGIINCCNVPASIGFYNERFIQ